ncbi:DUF1569 domain-containing protein [Arenibacter sp. 6A1]|uniref:DUF1569 domain-containing protein n=1 Tax=Arenibacter sp. 6A1 TaxID=2720391 RepID=UPI0014455C27|nr:DUF1569 domain-containing protein [Arenibacter sp. 6A1]NKI26327.1 DUF1569 domain-containing protein [Arenibacter sp. 6A1]
MKNVFDKNDLTELIDRIQLLSPQSNNLWGTMNVGQMLAHCNVTYEMIYTDKHPKPNSFMRFILTLIVKPMVVNEKPYKKNTKTAPQFVIAGERDFEAEKKRLIDYLIKTQELGETHFHLKESHSFGPLTKTEWSNLCYKHLDHHLSQFGV